MATAPVGIRTALQEHRQGMTDVNGGDKKFMMGKEEREKSRELC